MKASPLASTIAEHLVNWTGRPPEEISPELVEELSWALAHDEEARLMFARLVKRYRLEIAELASLR